MFIFCLEVDKDVFVQWNRCTVYALSGSYCSRLMNKNQDEKKKTNKQKTFFVLFLMVYLVEEIFFFFLNWQSDTTDGFPWIKYYSDEYIVPHYQVPVSSLFWYKKKEKTNFSIFNSFLLYISSCALK